MANPQAKMNKFREYITRLEQAGFIKPGCSGCKVHYASLADTEHMALAPSHKGSDNCQSGKRPHCTCDYCF